MCASCAASVLSTGKPRCESNRCESYQTLTLFTRLHFTASSFFQACIQLPLQGSGRRNIRELLHFDHGATMRLNHTTSINATNSSWCSNTRARKQLANGGRQAPVNLQKNCGHRCHDIVHVTSLLEDCGVLDGGAVGAYTAAATKAIDTLRHQEMTNLVCLLQIDI